MKLLTKSFFAAILLVSANAQAMVQPVFGDIAKDPRAYTQSHVEFSDRGFVEFTCDKCSALKNTTFIASANSCGSGGCDYLMFEKSGKTFKFVTKVFLATGAFQFLKTKNAGYPDLLNYVHQSADYGDLMTFKFDGKAYQPFGAARRVKSAELAKLIKAEPVKQVALSKDLKVLDQ